MDKNKGPVSTLKEWLSRGTEEKNPKLKKNQYIVLLLVVGVAIMLFSNFLTSNDSTDPLPVATDDNEKETDDMETAGKANKSIPSTMIEYEMYYENQLKEALEAIAGVGEVSVVVNVGSTEIKNFEKNSVNRRQITDETDANGGKRKVEDTTTEEQIVLIREGEKEVPLISQTHKPDIKGVLVVAKGAENIQVQKWIKEAVMATLDVPSHRVSVQPKK